MTKLMPRAKLSLCIVGMCWLAGCATSPSVELEAKMKSLDRTSPTPAVDPVANKSFSSEAYSEPTGSEKQEIHEDESIFFTLGSSSISRQETPKIDALAQKLRNDKNLVVTLIGHANDNGSSSFNLAVSDSRVMAVAEQLRKHGIQGVQIRQEALGSERTPKICRTSKCTQKWRRVEMVVTKAGSS